VSISQSINVNWQSIKKSNNSLMMVSQTPLWLLAELASAVNGSMYSCKCEQQQQQRVIEQARQHEQQL